MLKSRLTGLLVAGAVVGAGFTGYSAATLSPAIADPVRVEGPVAAPGFADVVDVVSPAVVSVRVRSTVSPVRDRLDNMMPRGFEDLPDGHPFRRFFREFEREFGFGDRRDRGPRAERPRRARPVSQGSGFFISDDGFLVTNNHVIENGEEFTVILNDGTEYDAELVGTDPRTDLAVLKVDEGNDFTYVDFAPDEKTRVGDWVVAVGNPFGLGGTVTAGIVSAFERDIGAGPYDQFIQIDAAVNRGNSGGPTFNLNGEVVGVNTAIFSPSGGNVGIAFAVPASVASEIVNDLIDDGNVQRGWLGVSIQPVTDEIAESLGLDQASGAIVSQLTDGTPAEEAGIRPGDIIIGVNETDVEGPRELSRAIAGFEPGTGVEITIIRDGDEQAVDVTLGELPTREELARAPDDEAPEAPSSTSMDDFGLTVVPSEDGDGVLVTDVEADSAAAEAGLRAGDIIREINNRAVTSAEDITQQIDAVKEQGRRAALLRVEGENNSRFAALSLSEDEG
ncbi:MAG: Do family serine endopeptidase [Pseudomonadota bacterium]